MTNINDEIFEEEMDDDEAIIQKYNKKIVFHDLTFLERLKIWLVYGIWIKQLGE